MLKLLGINNLSKTNILNILKQALKLEKQKYSSILKTKRILILMDSQSTRTRISTELAIKELGGNPLTISIQETQFKNERPKEFVKILEKYFDLILIRTCQPKLFKHLKTIHTPVINLLNKTEHPCQAISDLFTILKYKTHIKTITIGWIGRKNNMFKSWYLLSKLLKLKFIFNVNTKHTHSTNKHTLLKTADIIMTDSWSVIGETKTPKLKSLRIRYKDLKQNKPAIMHCMPIKINQEIDKKSVYCKHSLIFKQAYNKLTVMKAIIKEILGCA